MRTSEEALKAVPDSYREASFGLGAGKLRTIFTIVLPSAVPGILAGIILAIGRIIGRNSSTPLYFRNGCTGSESDGIRTYTGTSYVCTFQRRSSYEPGICDSSCDSLICTAHQRFIRYGGKMYRERITENE